RLNGLGIGADRLGGILSRNFDFIHGGTPLAEGDKTQKNWITLTIIFRVKPSCKVRHNTCVFVLCQVSGFNTSFRCRRGI
ncbi:MAG: hypothetical protein L6425_02935, partial [Candidatus Aminicenantes bacterium]|nr:hypothetical protein [Candidatus Aminicenantes bacterium]